MRPRRRNFRRQQSHKARRADFRRHCGKSIAEKRPNVFESSAGAISISHAHPNDVRRASSRRAVMPRAMRRLARHLRAGGIGYLAPQPIRGHTRAGGPGAALVAVSVGQSMTHRRKRGPVAPLASGRGPGQPGAARSDFSSPSRVLPAQWRAVAHCARIAAALHEALLSASRHCCCCVCLRDGSRCFEMSGR